MEQSSGIKYSSPKDALEQGESAQHRFDIIIDGRRIGAAEVDYFSKPLPLYQVTDVYVDFEHKGEGHATKILEEVERFLTEKKKPGVLVDAIISGDSAKGMYTRRGWRGVPNIAGLYVFNWPENVSLDVLAGYASRYTDHLERAKNSSK